MTEPVITEIATGLQFPEGPVWMPDGTVLCVELKRRTVDRVHPDGTVEVIAEPGGSPNGLAIGPDGAGYVCNSGGWAFTRGLRHARSPTRTSPTTTRAVASSASISTPVRSPSSTPSATATR